MNRRARCTVDVLALAVALMSMNVMADETDPKVSWSTGLEYSSGTYGGTEDTEDLYVPFQGRIQLERVSFDITVPYLSVRAPAGTTVIDPDADPVPGSGEMVTQSGLGDVIAGVTIYDVFYSNDLGLAMDLTGKIKFATADEAKGLGTGEQDFTLRADFFKFFEQFTLLASAGYKFRGDPADYDLENVFLGSIGGAFLPNERSSFGVVFDYRESALIDGDAVSEMSAFISRRINDSWDIQFYAFTGFSDTSADWGAGIQFRIS